jgi:hypothetical protein
MGWFTVVAYFATAWLCWRVVRTTAQHSRFWKGLAITFIALGLNKQLDLQSLFTAIGRGIAKSGGWYDDRHQVQTAFVIVIALIGFAMIALLCWHLRHAMREVGIALVGAIFVITFVIVRAASFHNFDRFLDLNILHFNMNWLLELSGIACVAIGAAWQIRRAPQPKLVQTPAAAKLAASPRVLVREIPSQHQSRESFKWMVERLKNQS